MTPTGGGQRRRGLGLVERRLRWGLTWRGWVAVVAAAAAAAVGAVRGMYGFLAVDAPVGRGVLVVEGWLPDAALAKVRALYRTGKYTELVVTGGPILKNDPLGRFDNYPQLMRAQMGRQGFDLARVFAVPCGWVDRDRTYASAAALRAWLQSRGERPRAIDLVTEAQHARRSRLMFEKALGSGVRVGVIATPPSDYDPRRWWTTSAGVRAVVGEAIAYGYARVFFWPWP